MQRILSFLLGGLAVAAANVITVNSRAAEVRKEDSGDVAGMTAVRLLNVREIPALDAPVVVQLPWGHEVGLHTDTYRWAGPPGHGDRWVFVTTGFCVGRDCERRQAGWLVEKYIATEDRLVPLTAWRVGEIAGYVGDYDYTIRTAEDGTFTHRVFACTAGLCGERRLANGCSSSTERRIGDHCVSSGRLYRYRDLVVAKTDEDYPPTRLYVEPSGALCSVDALRDDTRSCDR